MGPFLALLGIRLGRALVSWGLGSAGSGASPPPVEIAGPCITALVAVDPTFTSAVAGELELAVDIDDLTFTRAVDDLSFSAEVSLVC